MKFIKKKKKRENRIRLPSNIIKRTDIMCAHQYAHKCDVKTFVRPVQTLRFSFWRKINLPPPGPGLTRTKRHFRGGQRHLSRVRSMIQWLAHNREPTDTPSSDACWETALPLPAWQQPPTHCGKRRVFDGLLIVTVQPFMKTPRVMSLSLLPN